MRFSHNSLFKIEGHTYSYIYCVSVCASAYLCAPHACMSLQRSEKASGLLELELEMAMSHHVCSGNWTQVLCKNSKYYNQLNHLSCLTSPIFNDAPECGFSCKVLWCLATKKKKIHPCRPKKTYLQTLSGLGQSVLTSSSETNACGMKSHPWVRIKLLLKM